MGSIGRKGSGMGAELNLSELRQERLHKILGKLQKHSSSILAYTAKWKELEKQFRSVDYSVEERVKELELLENSVMERHEKLEAKEKKLEQMEESMKERMEEIMAKEKKLELRSVQNMHENHMEELREKERQFGLITDRINMEIERREKTFRKEYMERVEEFYLRKNEQELREKEIDKLSKEIELQGKRCEERSKELDLKEKQLQERAKELELKEEKPENPNERRRKRARVANKALLTEADSPNTSNPRGRYYLRDSRKKQENTL